MAVSVTLAVNATGAGGNVGVGDCWIFYVGHNTYFFGNPLLPHLTENTADTILLGVVLLTSHRIVSLEYVEDLAPK